jgi:DNA-directed RNA polymerase specialized sigma subunit, sigma24 homolog
MIFENEKNGMSNIDEIDVVIDGEEYEFEDTIDNLLFKDFEKKLQEEIVFEEDHGRSLSLEEAVYDYQKNGIKEAFDYIYEHYRPILDRLAYRKNDEDLSQELSEVLWNAVQRFDSTAGVKFNTFFWTCAQNHMGTQKIRRNAQKRSGAKKVTTTTYNPETGKEEEVTEIVKTKVVSLQATLNSKDSDTEVGSLIESQTFKNQYIESELDICLKKMFEDGLIKPKEMKAIQMIIEGSTLAEIGNELNGVTAPAIHVMLRRLGKKKQVRKYLFDILFQ